MIVDLDIHDQEGFEEYRASVPAFVAKYGGEYLVRGGEFEVIEGDWQPHRLVIFRFPDREAIRKLFADPDYAKLADVRKKTSKTIAVAVDGVE
jgi:uncharacterized protein (DUF1330 family)